MEADCGTEIDRPVLPEKFGDGGLTYVVTNRVEQASMAKTAASEAFRRTAAEGIKVHGGIAFTWEHDMHPYFKRAKSTELAFGDASFNREQIAQLIGL